ncbi:MAG: anthranilate synthase component I [Spirochaetia bacterium]|nr:anthranilate synthase component I [Spirochaetia bacterium]
MISPSLSEVQKLSKRYNIIPVYGETLADLETPLSAYMKIDNPEYSFLLESIEGGEKTARYSFLSRQPYEMITYEGGRVIRERAGKKTFIETRDPIGELKKIFGGFKPAPVKGIPDFNGGAVGYIGYDIIKLYEKVPHNNKIDSLGWPDMRLMFYDLLMVFDHVYHKMQVVQNIFVERGDSPVKIRKKYAKAAANIKRVIAGLKRPLAPARMKPVVIGPIKSLTKPADFKKTVKDTVSLLNDGEGIQVVVSQRFSAEFRGNPVNIYRSLRTVNPSPYMHFLRMGNEHIIGTSPELMIRVVNGEAELRPIAGTRRRGKTEREDAELEKELLSDIKERAEHVMLVDLGRNDLGRVCETGTVKVNDMFVVERYSHVMHLVSDVTGKLKQGLDCFDAFVSAFPAGTVSGAPKVRAMQIIDDKEKYKRGPYAGAVGMISFSGNMETCISIRTIYHSGGRIYMQSGAGIVADSKPDFEYKETLNKAKATFEAVKRVNALEE